MRNIDKELSEVAANYHFITPPKFTEDFLKWLGETLRALWQFLKAIMQPNGETMDSRGLSNVMQIGLFIVAAAAIAWAARYLIRRARTARGAALANIKGATKVEEILDSAGWSRQAEQLAAAGDYRNACRAVYLALLQQLHENRIASFAPTKTNFEYSYALAKFPQIQKPFKEIAESVESIWFGNKDAMPDDFDRVKTQLAGMDSEVRKTGASLRAAGDSGRAIGSSGHAAGDSGRAIGSSGHAAGDSGRAIGSSGHGADDSGRAIGDDGK